MSSVVIQRMFGRGGVEMAPGAGISPAPTQAAVSRTLRT